MSAVQAVELDGPVGRLVGTDASPGGAAVGLPVVLVHGINMAGAVWDPVAARLARTRRTIGVDLRGHGGSARQGPYTASGYADDVVAVLDHLAIDRAHVVGTSYGGSVACAVAAAVPDRVASVTAIGSALAAEGVDIDGAEQAMRAVGVRDFFAAFLPQASFAPDVDPILIEAALGMASDDRDVDTVVAVSRAALSADHRDLVPAVKAPALVVTGELDMTCPTAAGQAMAEALGTDLVVVPGRGHVLSLEDPAAVTELVEAHLARHDEAASPA